MAISINLTKTADALSGASSLAEAVVSSGNVIIALNTAQADLTAFVTGVNVVETKDGAPIFENGSVGSIFNIGTVTTPAQLSNASGAVVSSLTIPVSATGNACALGTQTLTYTISLSSKALSSNGLQDVTPTTNSSITTTITAVNTPYSGRTCRAEFARLRNLEII